MNQDRASARLTILARLLSPAHFGGAPQAGNVLPTLPYVPAPTLRGALGCLYRNELPGPPDIDEEFFSWAFLSGEVAWPDLRWNQEVFVPRSFRQCKDFGAAHPPFDELNALLTGNQHESCRQCGAALVRGKEKTPLIRPFTRTALRPQTRSAHDAMLHTVEAIEADQAFAGVLYCRDASNPYWARLVQWLDEAARESPPALGGGRTRGMGAVELSFAEAAPEPEPLRERLERWNAARRGAGTVFGLTLETPLLLRDRLWRWQRILTPGVLAEARPESAGLASALTLTYAWAESQPVGGWNQAAGVPRAEAHAIARGSAFLMASPESAETVLPLLEALERDGIGERRAEGYGRITVCQPAHLAH